jgi:hypothetical protein
MILISFVCACACPSMSRATLAEGWQRWRRRAHEPPRHDLLLQLGARTHLLLPMARAIQPASEARAHTSPASLLVRTPLLPVCHHLAHRVWPLPALPVRAGRILLGTKTTPVCPSSPEAHAPPVARRCGSVRGTRSTAHASARVRGPVSVDVSLVLATYI